MTNKLIYYAPFILTFCLSIFLFAKFRIPKRQAIPAYILSLLLIFLTAVHFIANYFTGNGIDYSTIFHLKYGIDGAGFKDYLSLITVSLLALITSLTLITYLIFKYENKSKYISRKISITTYTFLTLSFLLNPSIFDIARLYQTNQTSLEGSQTARSDFYNYYMGDKTHQRFKNPKNLVHIYVESLERTYFDSELFPNLITDLKNLESLGVTFTEIKQAPKTGWTIGGITSSECGIPLYTPSNGNSMSSYDTFLPYAVCLGDILKEQGYHLTFLGGADHTFAGKGKFFQTHGYDEVLGKNELLPKLKNQNYAHGWGLYDDSLFEIAFEKYLKLSANNENFALTTLTLDTHHPKGHRSASCETDSYGNFDNSLLDAVKCSDRMVANFIQKILNSSFAQNTIIVLQSDHFGMRSIASDFLKGQDRRNLLIIIDPEKYKNKKIDVAGTTLDIGSTILSVLGIEGQIGLGRNLFDESATTEKTRIHIAQNIKNWGREISNLWGFPKITGKFQIDIKNEIVKIGLRKFNIPVLVELDDQLNTIMRFPYEKKRSSGNYLTKKILAEKNSSPVILVDKCRYIDPLTDKKNDKFCVAFRGKNGVLKNFSLNNDTTYYIPEIKNMLDIN
ncbi:sulfatase-like hydrolase/transferase [Desulforhopalus singaporensis]|uniref:Phosphoglycerol transferase n=1 Tax=Desulforhopalus singaporensis TaxID=91360 RepID=A0A1H0TXC0_9BACT|nr:sulfatase-like hydrolase/transferase [Desulforhopalus singaporensis]SDP58420.1 phosphoglycerol transferase [Desulforhopalus singaporensis]